MEGADLSTSSPAAVERQRHRSQVKRIVGMDGGTMVHTLHVLTIKPPTPIIKISEVLISKH